MLLEHGLTFDNDDVICITKSTIPAYVKFIVSLGKKFAYRVQYDNGHMGDKIELEFGTFKERLLKHASSYGQVVLIDKEFDDRVILNSCTREIKPKTAPRMKHGCHMDAKSFIRTWMEHTKTFLAKHKTIIVAQADKGGKAIIIDKDEYQKREFEHITAGITNGTYEKIGTLDDIHRTRNEIEPQYENIRKSVNPFMKKDKGTTLVFEPYIMAKLVMSIKIHKEGYPGRPIIAAPDRWAKDLSKWILQLLNVIGDKFTGVKVRNSTELANKLEKNGSLKLGHSLKTFDYESMFTNIPYHVPRQIVIDCFHLVKDMTSMSRTTFIEAMDFIVESSAYFMCESGIFRQMKGLTMGNDLSQALADIATNKATMNVLASIPNEHVSFVYKYIDDFLCALDATGEYMFEERMGRMIDGLNLKSTHEDDNNTITFLDLQLKRFDDGSLSRTWWQKECSSKTILSYCSEHPIEMKINIAKQFMAHALEVSSPENYSCVIKKVKTVLRKSFFPKSIIDKILKWSLEKHGNIHITSTIGKPDMHVDMVAEMNIPRDTGTDLSTVKKRKSHGNSTKKRHGNNARFIATPFINQRTNMLINEFTKECCFNVKLAPTTISSNTSEGIYKSSKIKGPHSCIKFAIFSMKCSTCKMLFTFFTGNLDLERYLLDIKNGTLPNDTIGNYKHHRTLNPQHSLHMVPIQLRRYKTIYAASDAFNALKKRNVKARRKAALIEHLLPQ